MKNFEERCLLSKVSIFIKKKILPNPTQTKDENIIKEEIKETKSDVEIAYGTLCGGSLIDG